MIYIIATIIILLILIQPPIILFTFMHFIFRGKNRTGGGIFKQIGIWTIIVQPIIYLFFATTLSNDLLNKQSILISKYSPLIYVGVLFYSIAYIISIINTEDENKPILVELFTDVFLFLGIIINLILIVDNYSVHLVGWCSNIYLFFGHLPIVILLFMKLNHREESHRKIKISSTGFKSIPS